MKPPLVASLHSFFAHDSDVPGEQARLATSTVLQTEIEHIQCVCVCACLSLSLSLSLSLCLACAHFLLKESVVFIPRGLESI